MSVGFIYILVNPAFQDNILKIGKTTRASAHRIRELSTTGVPTDFRVAFEIESCDCDFAEALIHNWLAAKRYSSNREFFCLPLIEAIDLVTKAINVVENTPPENRVFVPLQRKIIISRPREISNFSPEVQSSIAAIGKNTAYIKKETQTVFRQNNLELDGAQVFINLSGSSWRDNEVSKEAIVYFSRPSNNLVVIPKKTVNKFIFEPYFQKTSTGYELLEEYKLFSHDNRRLNFKFKTEQDRLLVLFMAPTRYQKEPLPLLSLSTVYWPKIDLDESNPVSSLVDIIKKLCHDLSAGDGITAT